MKKTLAIILAIVIIAAAFAGCGKAASGNAVKITAAEGDGELVWLNDMAVVSRHFDLGNEEGRLMVVGPSRMNYNRIVSILDFTTSYIENQFKRKK